MTDISTIPCPLCHGPMREVTGKTARSYHATSTRRVRGPWTLDRTESPRPCAPPIPRMGTCGFSKPGSTARGLGAKNTQTAGRRWRRARPNDQPIAPRKAQRPREIPGLFYVEAHDAPPSGPVINIPPCS